MNKHSSIKPKESLLERAADLYDFGAAFRSTERATPPVAPSATVSPTAAATPVAVQEKTEAPSPAPRASAQRARICISPEHLAKQNLIVPDGPVTGLSEEFRIVKRQLLLAARGGSGVDVVANGARILVCSANPNEGKTYCATNLALSMASEKDNRVLLIDADFAKPSVLTRLGIAPNPGFMDALADGSCDAESLVLTTDIDGLSILPAGSQTNQDTEYLAASRTAAIIDQLTQHDPSRIIIFDSPPALAASPASVLALHVGQILMVVQADVTTDGALRDALSLLSGCEHVQLLLNRTTFSPAGRKFGHYYGYGAS
jgi:protein-tyrosine kinase